MRSESPSRPLSADYARRLDALRREAAEHGHEDLDYILELAVGMAERRIAAKAARPPEEQARLRNIASWTKQLRG